MCFAVVEDEERFCKQTVDYLLDVHKLASKTVILSFTKGEAIFQHQNKKSQPSLGGGTKMAGAMHYRIVHGTSFDSIVFCLSTQENTRRW